MGMMQGEGGGAGYDPVKLARAREQQAKAVAVEGPMEEWLIGMEPEVAEATLANLGLRFRIWTRQGVRDFMTTADWSLTRVNVDLGADGKIAEVLGRG